MVSDARKKTLINTKSGLEKKDLDIRSDIDKKTSEFNKLEAEKLKNNTSDGRKKSIINKQNILERDLVSLRANLEKNTKDYDKANAELNKP